MTQPRELPHVIVALQRFVVSDESQQDYCEVDENGLEEMHFFGFVILDLIQNLRDAESNSA